MKSHELRVEGMSCGHCISKVNKAIKKLDGSAEVEVDLGTQTVRVKTDAELEELGAAIEEAGYQVSSTKPNPPLTFP